MRIDVTGCVAELRNIKAVVAARSFFTERKRILEPPKLVEARHPKGLGVRTRAEAHAPLESALENREPAVRPEANEKKFPGLIGGKRQAQPLFAKPGGKLP